MLLLLCLARFSYLFLVSIPTGYQEALAKLSASSEGTSTAATGAQTTAPQAASGEPSPVVVIGDAAPEFRVVDTQPPGVTKASPSPNPEPAAGTPPVEAEVIVVEDVTPEWLVEKNPNAPYLDLPDDTLHATPPAEENSLAVEASSPTGRTEPAAGPSFSAPAFEPSLAIEVSRGRSWGEEEESAAVKRLLLSGEVCLFDWSFEFFMTCSLPTGRFFHRPSWPSPPRSLRDCGSLKPSSNACRSAVPSSSNLRPPGRKGKQPRRRSCRSTIRPRSYYVRSLKVGRHRSTSLDLGRGSSLILPCSVSEQEKASADREAELLEQLGGIESAFVPPIVFEALFNVFLFSLFFCRVQSGA